MARRTPGTGTWFSKSWPVEEGRWLGTWEAVLMPGVRVGRTRCFRFIERQKWLINPTQWHFSSVQSLSCVRLFSTPWTAAHQASLSFVSKNNVFIVWNLSVSCRLLPYSSNSNASQKGKATISASILLWGAFTIFSSRWVKKIHSVIAFQKKKGILKVPLCANYRAEWIQVGMFPEALPSWLVAQWCWTLYDPMDCNPPGSSVYGILQARILEWVAILFSVRPPQLRDRSWVSSWVPWRVLSNFLWAVPSQAPFKPSSLPALA